MGARGIAIVGGLVFILAGVLVASCGGSISDEMELEAQSIAAEGGVNPGRDGGNNSADGNADGANVGDTGTPFVCTPRAALTVGTEVTQTPIGTSHFLTTCNGANADGPEDVYSLKITQRSGLRIRVTTTGTTPVIKLLKACDPNAAATLCRDSWPGKAKGFALLQEVVDPGDYFVVIDQALGGAPAAGAYTLNAAVFEESPNAKCSGAISAAPAIDATTTLNGNLQTAFDPTSKCTESDCGHLFFKIAIPPGQEYTCTLTPTTSTWTGTITASEGSACPPTACFDKKTATADGAAVALSFQNFATAAQSRDMILSVSGTDVLKAGAFTLAIAAKKLDLCPPNTPDGTLIGTTQHCCSGTIVSNSAKATCGTSCSACAEPAHTVVSCDGTACQTTCDPATPNFKDCSGGILADGCETNTSTSVNNCGACNAPTCPANGGTAKCVGGLCDFDCTLPKERCGGTCLDTTNGDVNNCGGCNVICPNVAGTTKSCVNRTCTYACLAGYCPPVDNTNHVLAPQLIPTQGCSEGNRNARCSGASGCGFCQQWVGYQCEDTPSTNRCCFPSSVPGEPPPPEDCTAPTVAYPWPSDKTVTDD